MLSLQTVTHSYWGWSNFYRWNKAGIRNCHILNFSFPACHTWQGLELCQKNIKTLPKTAAERLPSTRVSLCIPFPECCGRGAGETVPLFHPFLLIAPTGDVSETLRRNVRLLVNFLGKTDFQCAWQSYRRKEGEEGPRLIFQASAFLDMLLVLLINPLHPKQTKKPTTLPYNSLTMQKTLIQVRKFPSVTASQAPMAQYNIKTVLIGSDLSN